MVHPAVAVTFVNDEPTLHEMPVVAVADNVPVLQLAVEQHLYAAPAHTPNTHTYVFDEHEMPDETHEYTVPVIDPAAYVEAVYFKY